MRLLEGLSETLRFSIFSSLFLLSLYFLSYNFLYHKIYSLFLSLHPKNKTLAHLPLRLCLVPGKCERKKIGRKNGRKEKAKEKNINFFTCLVIHEKFKEKKKKNSFSFVWLTTKKSQGKMEGKQNQQFVLEDYQFVE